MRRQPLSKTHPEVALCWDNEKNGKLTPDNISCGSRTVVHWICPVGHEYTRSLLHRASGGRTCSICKKAEKLKGISFADKQPRLVSLWHPTKNGDLKPTDVTPGSSLKVWWKCDRGHEYQQIVYNKSRGNGCSVCKNMKNGSLEEKNPPFVSEWYYEKNNNLLPSDFGYGSQKKVWWKCLAGHEWIASIGTRSQGSNCPECSKCRVRKGNIKNGSLEEKNPPFISEWHKEKNNDLLPSEVGYASHKRVWWKCVVGHEWQAVINSRTRGSNCPECGIRKIKSGGSLADRYSKISNQWDYDKNGILTPEKVTYASHKTIWWKCTKGHSWEQTISHRTMDNQQCPECKVINNLNINSLKIKRKLVADEWNYEKNEINPEDIAYKSNKIVWWRCDKGHEWMASICNRSCGTGCPQCSGLVADKNNNFGIKYPKLLLEWNYKKNSYTPFEITPKSHKQIHWKCNKGHEWTMMACQRAIGQGCQKCANENTHYSKCAIKWLNKIAEDEDIFINHAENDGEHRINLSDKKYITVDGYCEETNTIYEYNRCLFCGCRAVNCHILKNNKKSGVNPINKKKYIDLYNSTMARNEAIKKSGYNFVTMWECEDKFGIIPKF
jgi:hypothetical protein